MEGSAVALSALPGVAGSLLETSSCCPPWRSRAELSAHVQPSWVTWWLRTDVEARAEVSCVGRGRLRQQPLLWVLTTYGASW